MAQELGSASGSVLLDISDAMQNADRFETRIGSLGSSASRAGQNASKGLTSLEDRAKSFEKSYGAAGRAMTVFGGVVAAGFGASIFAAAGFEKGMSNVGASLGGVGTEAGITEDQLKALNQEALNIGKDTAFSASEAAAAMDVLAKAGVSADDIIGGVARSSVDLAAAIGEQVPNAAEGIAAAMSIFNSNVEQPLTDSAAAADTFTAAINASQTDLTDFNAGLRNFGPAAAAMGLSFEEVAGSIAYFTQFGLKGADVGVSLNAAMTNLAKPTQEASDMMAQLGISAFDAQGEFIGFPALMDQLQGALGGADDATRELALRTIFGAEAADVMAIAVKNGGDGLAEMTGQMAPAGQAADQAAQRMDNLSGDVQALQGSLETIGITIGQKVLPFLRTLTQGATTLANGFLSLPGPVQAVGAALIGAAGGLSLMGGAAIMAYPKFLELQASFQKIQASSGPLGAAFRGVGKGVAFLQAQFIPLLIIAAIVAAAFLAYKTNFLGFGDLVDNVAGKVSRFVGLFVDGFKTFNSLTNPVSAAVLALSYAFDSLGLSGVAKQIANLNKTIEPFIDRILGATKKITGGFVDLFKAIKKGDPSAIFRSLRKILAGLGDALSAPAKAMGDFLKNIQTGFAPLDRAIHTLGKVWTDWGRLIQEVFQGDFKGALAVGERLARHFWEFIQQAGSLTVKALVAGFEAIPWTKIGAGILTGAKAALVALAGLGADAWSWLVDAFQAIDWGALLGGVISGAGDLAGAIASRLGGFFGDLWGGIQSIDWGRFVPNLSWSDFVSGAINLAEKVKNLDWGKWISAGASGVLDLVTFVKNLDWGKWISAGASGVVDLATFVKDLDWGKWIWAGAAGSVNLAEKAKNLNWSQWIRVGAGGLLDLLSYVKDLDWGQWITAGAGKVLDLATYVEEFSWDYFVDYLNWFGDKVNVGAFPGWGSFVKVVDWFGDKIHVDGWPGWGTYVPLIKWVEDFSLSSFPGWDVKIPWPSIPDFPGWPSPLDIAKAIADKVGGGGGDNGNGDNGNGDGTNNGESTQAKSFGGGPNLSGLGHGDFGSGAAAKATAALAAFGARATATAATAGAAFNKIAAIASAASSQVQGRVSAMAGTVLGRVSAMASQVAAQGQRGFQQLTAAASSGASRAQAIVSSATGQIQGRVSAMASQVASAGRSGFSAFASAASSGMNQAVGAASSGAARIVGAIRSIGSMYSFGSYIGSTLTSGIADAIRAGTNAVASAAANAVTSAMNAARSAAGNPHSPSPVMWDRVGWPLVQALIDPWAAGSLLIRRAASGAVAGALSAAQGAMGSDLLLGRSISGSLGIAGGGGGGGTIQNYEDHRSYEIKIDGAGDPDAVADRVIVRLSRGQEFAKPI